MSLLKRIEERAVERSWPLSVGWVRLTAVDPAVCAGLEPWLAFFLPAVAPSAGSDAEDRGGTLHIEFAADGSDPALAADAPPLVEYYYVTGRAGAKGPIFRTAAGSWLELDVATARACGWAAPGDLEGPPWALRDLFNAVLTAWLRSRGRFGLHAAALARGDDGVLVVGSAMAGKTTFGLNLARHGWDWVADDKVLLMESPSGALEARGLFRHANLDPELARWFPELAALAGRPPVFPHTTKRAVDLTEITPGPATPLALRPGRLLFPELFDLGPTRVEPLDAEAAFLTLLRQAPLVAERREAGRHVALLRRLALEAPAFRIVAGRDLLSDPRRFPEVARELLLDTAPARPFRLRDGAPPAR